MTFPLRQFETLAKLLHNPAAGTQLPTQVLLLLFFHISVWAEPPGPSCERCYEAGLMRPARKKDPDRGGLWDKSREMRSDRCTFPPEAQIEQTRTQGSAFEPRHVFSANIDARVL